LNSIAAARKETAVSDSTCSSTASPRLIAAQPDAEAACQED
jgi:hypothetical protein